MPVIIEDIRLLRDERGSLFEPLGPPSISAQENVHVVLTEPGCVRGNHYHREATEMLAVLGPALVRVLDGPTVRDTTVPAGRVMRFVIPPGVPHAIQNIGHGPLLLVAFQDRPHDARNPDVWSEILITPAGQGAKDREQGTG